MSSTMFEKIEIEMIDSDLNHEDTIIQITNCLDNLQSAASHIFESIDKRISVYSERLASVKEKTCIIQEQLDYLQNNMNLKAVKMYSDSKYPAYSTYQEYKTITDFNDDKLVTNSNTNALETLDKQSRIGETCKTTSNVDHYSTKVNLKEKLQFYYVKPMNTQESPIISKPIRSSKLSVNRVASVSALLISESLKPDTSQQNSSGLDSKEMQDAPDSILQPWHSTDFHSPSYLYAPTLGEVPQIDVPAILPDLPGIVDDEKFILDFSCQNPIAPSSAVTSPISKIERSKDILLSENQNKPSDEFMQPLNLPKIIDNESLTLHPPPPPPPPPEVIQEQAMPINIKMPTEIQPPPPPPPPTISEPSTSSTTTEEKSKPKIPKSVPAATGDDRTSLMAAIRAAGGIGKAKLKPAVDEVKNPSERWSSASVGGDLMADLHAKLSLRRKGIAGGGMGALERISRLIPPPPKPNEASDITTSDGDSQSDEDDWEA